jgi:two-component system, OmpR family, alkaline phosphatase synthesis response regulator PhoP
MPDGYGALERSGGGKIMTAKLNILVIEDDEDIASNIKYNLEMGGRFNVKIAASGEKGLALFDPAACALVILDLNLPGMSGFEICRTLRARKDAQQLPILMLSARSSEDDKVNGLELGADDYVTKPFSMRELKARVDVLLKRQERPATTANYDDGHLTIDFDTMAVTLNGQALTLSRKEFQLLKLFIENRGRILTREVLLERIWGFNYLGESRTIDVHISRLRQKLSGGYIETVVGIGYRCKDARNG